MINTTLQPWDMRNLTSINILGTSQAARLVIIDARYQEMLNFPHDRLPESITPFNGICWAKELGNSRKPGFSGFSLLFLPHQYNNIKLPATNQLLRMPSIVFGINNSLIVPYTTKIPPPLFV